MNKKLVALVLCVAIIASALTAGTLAYFQDKEEKTNTFTVGNVDIQLTEPAWDGTNEGEGQGQKDAPEVYPGEALAKDPQVTNIGENPCFVRIKVEGLDCLGNAGMIQYRTNYDVGKLGADWEKYGDYYYYKHVLNVDETTKTPLFDSIVIPTGLENGDGEAEFDIDITAEAIQAQGAKPSWSAVEAMTVEEIAAWFGNYKAN